MKWMGGGILHFSEILKTYFKNNIILFIVLFSVLVIGIVIGSISVNLISDIQTRNILTFINGFLSSINNVNINSSAVFSVSLSNNLKVALILIISGLTVIGMPVIFVTLFFRGLSLGFTVGFFIREMGIKGVIFSLLAILPQNIIIIPAIISIGVTGIMFSKAILKNKKHTNSYNYPYLLLNYGILNFMFCISLLIASLIEGYISPTFIKFMSNHLAI